MSIRSFDQVNTPTFNYALPNELTVEILSECHFGNAAAFYLSSIACVCKVWRYVKLSNICELWKDSIVSKAALIANQNFSVLK